MKTVIIGAGELGRGLIPLLIDAGHEIVLLDNDSEKLSQLGALYDIMTLCGDAARLTVLNQAGIETCQVFIAASSNDAVNLLACQTAKRNKVPTIVCRCHGIDYFSEEEGITPETFGICRVIDSEAECAQRVASCLDNRFTLEKIFFSNADAVLTAVKIIGDSPITGFPLRLLPERERLDNVRLAGVVRQHKLIVPCGDTTLQNGDEIYIAGEKKDVDEMIQWVTPSHADLSRAVIAGGGRLSRMIADSLERSGASVSVIEPDEQICEELLQSASFRAMVINGAPTDNTILREAGVDKCDVFISAMTSDEDNILCGILARRCGAKKVIVTTTKSEYIDVVPEIDGVTTGVNSSLVAVNAVIDAMPHAASEYFGVGTVLQRARGYVREFTVLDKSPICNQPVKTCTNSIHEQPIILSLVFRGDTVFVPNGDFILREGDRVAALTTDENLPNIKELFRPRGGLFSL